MNFAEQRKAKRRRGGRRETSTIRIPVEAEGGEGKERGEEERGKRRQGGENSKKDVGLTFFILCLREFSSRQYVFHSPKHKLRAMASMCEPTFAASSFTRFSLRILSDCDEACRDSVGVCVSVNL